MNTDLMTKDFADGAHYQGGFTKTRWMRRKIPHGEGTCKFANGDLFVGVYERGQPVKGTITNASRAWKGHTFAPNDRYPRRGVIESAGGRSKYNGAMQQGRAHGVGTKEWFDISGSRTARCTGEWADGYLCNGSYTYVNGDRYKGRWKDKLPHDSSSNALFEYADGRRYEGPVEAGKPHGEGRLFWLEQGKTTTLYATFAQGNASGDARIAWLGGAQWFTGPLDALHQPAGPGTYTFLSENKVYIGEAAHRLPHGQGKMAWLNTRSEYTGHWQAGRQHGRGTFDAPTHRYSGPWFLDAMHCGPGETGLYEWHGWGFKCEGVFLHDAFPTDGKFTYPDERTYEGRLTTCGFPANDPQGIGQAPMQAPLDTSMVAIKRAHLRRTLDALVSHNGNTVVTAVRLDCGHELDLSEVERMAQNRKLTLVRVLAYETQKNLVAAAACRNTAKAYYRCPCCREDVTKEPAALPFVSQIQSFLKRVGKDFRDNCMSDAEFSKKYDALVEEGIVFPTINNGRPA